MASSNALAIASFLAATSSAIAPPTLVSLIDSKNSSLDLPSFPSISNQTSYTDLPIGPTSPCSPLRVSKNSSYVLPSLPLVSHSVYADKPVSPLGPVLRYSKNAASLLSVATRFHTSKDDSPVIELPCKKLNN